MNAENQSTGYRTNSVLNALLLFLTILSAIRCAWLLLVSGTSLNLFSSIVKPAEYLPLPFYFPLLLAGLTAFLLFRSLSRTECEKIWRSFLTMLPVLVLPEETFVTYPVSIFLASWSVFRFLATRSEGFLSFFHKEGSPLEKRGLPYAVFLLYALLAAWGFYMQEKAYRSLFLGYADWGFYVESYLDLIRRGKWENLISIGSHWNGTVNWFMILCLWICPCAQTIFLINTLVLWSAIPVGYLCCRKWNVPERLTFLLMILIALNPVYNCLHLCIFYGFHPVYFIIPAVLLFLYFRESRNKIGMGLCFIYTLFVQETMFIFWVGYGLWLFWKKRRIAGTVLMLGCVLGFFLISAVILPEFSGTEGYGQINVGYTHLGNNFKEIAMSPFVRPAIFWSTLLHWRNFLFAGMLLLPFFFVMTGKYFSMIVIAVPILFGIFLKAGFSVKIILLQYSLESTLIFTAASLLNFRENEFQMPRWAKFLHSGIKDPASGKNLQNALLGGALIASLLAFHCFAYNFFGKNEFNELFGMPEKIHVLKEFEQKIPANARVLSSFRPRAFFAFNHKTGNFPDKRNIDDFIVMTLQDPVMDNPAMLENTRRELALSPNAVPILSRHAGGSDFVLWHITDDPVLMKQKLRLPLMPEEFFLQFGQKIILPDPAFAVRYQYSSQQNRFCIRLQKTPGYDVDFLVRIKTADGENFVRRSFADGIYPANTQKPGTVFLITIPGAPAQEAEIIPVIRPGYR